MSRKLRVWLPPAFALLVLAVPLRDLARRLPADPESSVLGSESSPERGVAIRREEVPTSDLSRMPVLPGKIIRERTDAAGRHLVITADAGETAEILEILHRSGSVRTLTLIRSGMNWEVRMDLDNRHRAEADREVSLPREQVAAILGVANTDGWSPIDDGHSAPITQQQTEAITPDSGTGSFGTVLFRSGRRMSWQWDRNVLVLEEN